MMQLVFDKTEKGREEIATRRYQLAAKVRSILLLVDGKQSGEALLQKYAGIGVSGQALQDLIDGGFISPRAEATPAATVQSTPAATAVTATVAEAATFTLPEGQTQHQAIYQLYCETIKANLGLRGLPLQLKVEKCSSVDDLRALRTAYLEALLKARGAETARSLRDRLDLLLNLQVG
jgi:hypothetical protein